MPGTTGIATNRLVSVVDSANGGVTKRLQIGRFCSAALLHRTQDGPPRYPLTFTFSVLLVVPALMTTR